MDFQPGAFFPVEPRVLKKAGFYEQIFDLNDANMGFAAAPEQRRGRQFSVRVILHNGAGEICVVRSLKNGYIQLPGGGVEPGETIEQALRRETREETGCEIEAIRPLGYGTELMFGGLERWIYVFEARATRFLGTEYTADEKAEEYEPDWMAAKTAEGILEVGEANFAKKAPEERNYPGAFANRRDWLILRALPGVLERAETRKKYQVVKVLGLVITGVIGVGLVVLVIWLAVGQGS